VRFVVLLREVVLVVSLSFWSAVFTFTLVLPSLVVSPLVFVVVLDKVVELVSVLVLPCIGFLAGVGAGLKQSLSWVLKWSQQQQAYHVPGVGACPSNECTLPLPLFPFSRLFRW
jgi:hypothetical protein